jgi:hypothetical protein
MSTFYGPTLSELGADPSSPSIIGTPEGDSEGGGWWDSILPFAQLGTAITVAALNRNTTTIKPRTPSPTVSTPITSQSWFPIIVGGLLLLGVIVLIFKTSKVK